MDPGLKLTIQRRQVFVSTVINDVSQLVYMFPPAQWTDFTDSAQFSDSCTKLLDAIHTLIGDGSGPERCIQLNTTYIIFHMYLCIFSEECEQSQTVEV